MSQNPSQYSQRAAPTASRAELLRGLQFYFLSPSQSACHAKGHPVGVTRPLRNLMSTDVGWAPARALNRAHEAFDRLSAQHSGRSRQCARSSNAPAARRPSSTLSARCLLRRRPHSLSTRMSSVRRKPVRLLTDGPSLTVGIGAARTNRALWRICELGGCWTCPDPIQPSLSPMLCSRECLVPKGSAISKLKRHRAAGYEDHLTRQSAMFLPSGLVALQKRAAVATRCNRVICVHVTIRPE